MVSHESKEALGVRFWVNGRCLAALLPAQAHFVVMFSLFLEVKGLQVVDNRQIVDVFAAARNLPMLVASVTFLKSFDQFQ